MQTRAATIADHSQQLKELHDGMAQIWGDMASSHDLNDAMLFVESQIQRLHDLVLSKSGQSTGKDPLINFGSFTNHLGMGESSYQEGSTFDEGIIKAKTIRLDFPRFEGEDPEMWSCPAEQFFDFYNTPPNHRISISSFHMDGHALVWFRELRASNSLTTWEEFVRAMQIRFGRSSYDDPMETLSNSNK